MKNNYFLKNGFPKDIGGVLPLFLLILTLLCCKYDVCGQYKISTFVDPDLVNSIGYGDSLALNRIVIQEDTIDAFPKAANLKQHKLKIVILGDYIFSTYPMVLSDNESTNIIDESIDDVTNDTLITISFGVGTADELSELSVLAAYIKPKFENTSPSCSLLVILDSASTGNIIVQDTIGLFDMVSPSLEVTFDSTACDKQTYSLSAKIINAGSLWAI